MQIQDALGDWAAHPGPLYARLATAIREAIALGDISSGSPLPPERSLATRLAIGRSTVVAAYARLREEGLVETRQGSGTWVCGATRHRADESPRESLRVAALRDAPALIDLATAALPAPPLLRELIRDLAGEDAEALFDTPGYLPGGLPALRHTLAAQLTAKGLPTSPDEILVTTGDQQALSLLCAHLLNPGDVAVVEDPTSPGVLDVLNDLTVTVRGVRPVVFGHEDFIRLIDRSEARLAYLMPALGPQGRILDEAARLRLTSAITERPVLVIEDTSQAGLTFESSPPPLATTAENTNLITVGSLTKLHWGGLRLGWIRGSAPLIARLTRAKVRADLGTPLLDQLLAVRLIANEEQIREQRLTTLHRCLEHAAALLPKVLPDFSWQPPEGGLNLWLRLPAGTATALAEVATRFGVAVVPGALLSPQGTADDHIRLVYTRSPEIFDEGIRRLAAAWQHYRRAATTTAATDLPHAPVLI